MSESVEPFYRDERDELATIYNADSTHLTFIDDESIDLVVANGVINHLIPDKLEALTEVARVLKPGGRLLMGDMAVGFAMPAEVREIVDLWTG